MKLYKTPAAIRDETGRAVCITNDKRDEDEIIRAVNAYPVLLDALKQLQAAVNNYRENGTPDYRLFMDADSNDLIARLEGERITQ